MKILVKVRGGPWPFSRGVKVKLNTTCEDAETLKELLRGEPRPEAGADSGDALDG